jgi:metallophosphoesterase (TIGR00282 family)
VRRVLFVGDVVGDAGVELLCATLPALRARHGIETVIANGENSAADGRGMCEAALTRMLDAGVDVVTGGNHSWEHPDSVRCLEHPAVLRPLNVPDGVAGRGTVRLELDDGPLTVVNVGDSDAIVGTAGAPSQVTDLLGAVEGTLSEDSGDVVVDIHAEHVYSKQALGHALDGRAAAVLGTHTHEGTLRLRRLPGGTALVTDVGMTGCPDGVMGFTPEAFVRGLAAGAVAAGEPAMPSTGTAELSAVLVDVDRGRSVGLARVTESMTTEKGERPG